MESNIENLKKKIIYRSQYRGTKEMDKLLSAFVLKHINNLNIDQLNQLENFLSLDDESLYKFYNNIELDFNFEDNEITNLFKSFKFNNK